MILAGSVWTLLCSSSSLSTHSEGLLLLFAEQRFSTTHWKFGLSLGKKPLSPQQLPVFKRADWNVNWHCRERSKFPCVCGWTFPGSPCPLAYFLKNSAAQSRSWKCNPFCHQMMDTLVTRARDTYTAIRAQIKRENVRINQNSGTHLNALMSGWVLCNWQKFLHLHGAPFFIAQKGKGEKKKALQNKCQSWIDSSSWSAHIQCYNPVPPLAENCIIPPLRKLILNNTWRPSGPAAKTTPFK